MRRLKPKATSLALIALLTACGKPPSAPIYVQTPPPPPSLMGSPPGPFLPSAQGYIETWRAKLTGSVPSS